MKIIFPMVSLFDGKGSHSVQKIRLLIADQGDGGIGGSGTGGGGRGLLDPLRLCACHEKNYPKSNGQELE